MIKLKETLKKDKEKYKLKLQEELKQKMIKLDRERRGGKEKKVDNKEKYENLKGSLGEFSLAELEDFDIEEAKEGKKEKENRFIKKDDLINLQKNVKKEMTRLNQNYNDKVKELEAFKKGEGSDAAVINIIQIFEQILTLEFQKILINIGELPKDVNTLQTLNKGIAQGLLTLTKVFIYIFDSSF